MSQQRKFQKTSNWNMPVQCKHRIGNREDGQSAMKMSTKDLLEVLSNGDKAKYHANAVVALKTRGNLAQ